MDNGNFDKEEIVNDAFKVASIGDKIWLFFSKHKRSFFALLAAAVVVVLVALMTFIGRNFSHNRMQKAYLQAVTSNSGEARLNFADKYISEDLGGLVFLELADEAYASKNYKLAAEYFRKATLGLRSSVFGGRAAIGEAISLIESGFAADGEKALEKVVAEKSYPDLVRGRAQYLLGLSYFYSGNLHAAKDTLNKLANSNFAENLRRSSKEFIEEFLN